MGWALCEINNKEKKWRVSGPLQKLASTGVRQWKGTQSWLSFYAFALFTAFYSSPDLRSLKLTLKHTWFLVVCFIKKPKTPLQQQWGPMKTIKTGGETPTSMPTCKTGCQKEGAGFKISKAPAANTKMSPCTRHWEHRRLFTAQAVEMDLYEYNLVSNMFRDGLPFLKPRDFPKSPNIDALGFSTRTNKTPESSPQNCFSFSDFGCIWGPPP